MIITEMVIKSVLQAKDPKLLEKFYKFQDFNEVDNDTWARWCPRIDCGGWAVGDGLKFEVICNRCLKPFCWNCGLVWHKGINCDEAEERGIIRKSLMGHLERKSK